jgi:hypothetical protein
MSRVGIICFSVLLVAAITGANGAADARPAFEAETPYLYSAQPRLRVFIQPRHRYLPPNAKRYCRSWLAKEYRVSGPVIVPQMHCQWR